MDSLRNMLSTRNTSIKWCIRKEESNSIRYGSINDELYGFAYFPWGFTLQTAAYILNRIPSKSVSTTPYEIWHGKAPSLKHVKIWGCPTYIKAENK